ncbi:MAG: hypothetical protein AAB772_01120 [Patescibacteria group bacterium]
MRKIIVLGIFPILLVVGANFSHAQDAQSAVLPNPPAVSLPNPPAVSLPNPGLVPGNPFYFLDRIGEAVREFFTFNPEAKARLQVNFAAERIAEIKIIFETKGVNAPGLDIAQSRLKAHFAKAANIVENEKSKGKEVSELAKSLSDDFDENRTALEQTFKTEKEALKIQIKELKEKIKEVRKAGDSLQLADLTSQLDELKSQKELLEQKEHDQEDGLDEEEERLEKEVEERLKAEKAIKEAEEEKQEIIDEANDEGLQLPSETFSSFEQHLIEAKNAFSAGKFEEAEHHAEEAKESLEKIEHAIDDLEKAEDAEEELKQEVETGKGKIERQTGKDAEQLEKEAEKASEAVRKAQDKLREIGNEMDED